VIGVLESKGESSWGRDQDDVVMVPVTTAQKRLFGMPRPDMVSSITVKVRSEDLMSKAQEEVTFLLSSAIRFLPLRTMTSPSGTWSRPWRPPKSP